ncbi:MAG: enoyl-CoA hydratase/isomerase family protein [Deltaproteobacteria bacterium]|nr:enoyl-CoA hydratase/isomerase family protein [Deltaproteobacteria bacterium]
MSETLAESVRVHKEGQLSHLVLNRAAHLNALNPEMLQTLLTHLERLNKNEKVRVLVISADGEKAFVAGADINSMASLGPRPIADYVELGQRVMRQIETVRFPVIAAVHGYALGGGLELALACDLIVAADDAKLGQPEVGLGILPGFGGTQRLIHRCGVAAARRLVYTGEIISAEEALRLGIVDKLVPRGEIIDAAYAWANTIIQKAPLAVAASKRVIRESQDQCLNAGLRLEVAAFLELFPTLDREEGMDAFKHKREAKFTGK